MEQKKEFNDCLKNIMINNVNFSYWNNVYEEFINMSQCGRFDFQEINKYINILLSSNVICMTKNEETILKLQKYKLEILKIHNPYKDTKGNSGDSIRKIKEYKEYIGMPIMNYFNQSSVAPMSLARCPR